MSKKEKSDSAENIKVIVRCRPLNGKEKEAGYKSAVDLNVAESTVTVNHVMGQPDRWTFDGVVNNTFSQKDVFTQFIVPMIDNVMDGFNATVFAYGQSGSGKTHTMSGKPDSEELMGIIPRTFDHIFEQARLAQELHPGRKYSMSCSYIELYNGKVRDLLAKKQETLEVKENKDKTFYVKGVTQPQVKFAAELRNIVDEGTDRRQVSATELNADSSRSHSIFTLIVEMLETSEDGDARSVTSKFNLVDLAGSERQSKTGAQGDTLKEGCNINLSLSALGTVIDCLVKAKPHVPFRSSPLTMLLKDSLGGSSKTCMFANVGPSEHNVAETVSTLRFADRAKQIKNKPVVNMDTKDQKIAELTAQVAELKDKLKQFEGDGLKQLEDEVEKLRERVGELEVDLDNATKSREADRSEFNEVTHNKAAELEALQQQAEEQKVTLAALQSEMDLAVQQARDQKRDTAELWRILHAEVGPGFAKPDADPADEDGDIDMLAARLQELKANIPREQFENAEAALRAMAAAREDEKIAHDAAIADFQGQIQSTKEELEETQKQVERLKEKAGRHDSSPSKSTGGGLDATSASVGDSVVAAAELAKRDAEIERLRAAVSNNAETKAADAEIARSRQAHATEVAALKNEVETMRAAVAAGLGKADPASAAGQMRQVFDAQTEALAAARAQLATLEAEHLKLLQARGALPAGAAGDAIARLGEQRDAERKDLGAVVAQRNALLLDAARSAPTDVQQHAADVVKENTTLRAVSTSQAKAADNAALANAAPAGDADLRAENRRLQEQLEALRGLKRAAAAARSGSSQSATDVAKFIAERKSAAGGDDPVASAVEALMRDREALESEVARQAAELQALGTSGAAAGETLRHGGSGRFNVSALDPDELRDEVLDLQSDLAKVKALRETAAKEKAEAAQEAVEMKQALAGVSRELAAAQEKVKAMEAEREAARDAVAQQYASKLSKLEARLKERTEQQQEMRKLVETQKVVADALKAKMEALNAQLGQSQADLAEKDRKLAAARDTQDASFQKLLGRRLEEQAEEHRKALLRREDDHGALRKKLKKAEAKVEKMKEKFDEKVYEYEELASRMEEQKLEYMKSLVGKEVVVVEEAKAQVRDALRAAKEDRQRQLDAFNNGTIGGARAAAAGSAAQAAARLRSAIGPTTPPAEDVVVVPSHMGGRPPPGYTQGKAIAAASNGDYRMGGAGYSSVPVARPPTGTVGQGFRRPPSARGGVTTEDDDMYNF